MEAVLCELPLASTPATTLPFWTNAQLPTDHDTANALPTPWIPTDAECCEFPHDSRSNKRMRLSFDDVDVEDLSLECDRLRSANSMLQTQLDAVLSKVHSAIDENRTLVKLIAALQPHKQGFTLQPSTSFSSASPSGTSLSGGFAGSRNTAARMNSLEVGSSDTSMPNTPGKGSSEGRGAFHRSRSNTTDDTSQDILDLGSADVCVEQAAANPETAETEAIAAAALAVNHGNPAAALIDLLMLSRKRSGGQLAPAL